MNPDIYPFSQDIINTLLDVDPDNQTRLLRKESNLVEYKQSFGRKSFDAYARTLAAFANAEGGYLIFGIDDSSRKIVGLQTDHFDLLDPRIPTEHFNNRFAPEIRWCSQVVQHFGARLGLIYAYPAQNKPVIAISSGDRIREGEIYFRYNGRTENIKYAELKILLDEERRKEQAIWLKHIQRLATIGVDNAAVLSLADGVATGKCGAFVIDSELLPKLQFIREGEFQETTGAPTVRIIGDAEILGIGQVTPVQTQVRPTVILPTDIIEKFLMQNCQTGPLEYIKAICFEQSPYMPIYYYARQVEMSHNDLVKFVENSNGIGRRLLLKRLNEDDAHARYYKLPKGEISASKRLGIVEQIRVQRLELQEIEDLAHVLQAIQLLGETEIKDSYVFMLLHQLYNMHWHSGGNTTSLLRKAICHVDFVQNRYLLGQNN